MIERVATTTPAKALEGLRARMDRIQVALADPEMRPERRELNLAELEKLRDLVGGWEAERRGLRDAWEAHHRRQFRIHQRLAREHYAAWIRLYGALPGSCNLAGDRPSPNGKH